MLYHLFEYLNDAGYDFPGSGLMHYISFRAICCAIVAILTSMLVGKKIIVVANLKPTRITGVTSQGMLLAGTNNACGCKVIFVDDSIPVGTQIK